MRPLNNPFALLRIDHKFIGIKEYFFYYLTLHIFTIKITENILIYSKYLVLVGSINFKRFGVSSSTAKIIKCCAFEKKEREEL